VPSRLLIVSLYYWPEETGTAPYATDLAEHLAGAGHDVTVLTGLPHYPAWRVEEGYGRSGVEERAGVRIVRRRHTVPRRQSALRRAAYEASFLASALPFRCQPRPDAVVGFVPSLASGALARINAARARAAYGVILHDLVGVAAAQTGISGGQRAATAVALAERWVMRRATVVAPLTDLFVPYLTGLGVAEERIEVLPVWSRMPPPAADRSHSRRTLGWRDDELVALHAGNMGLKQGLEQLVDAARLADEQRLPVRFVLVGDGNQRQALEQRARGIERIEFRPLVPEADFPAVLAAADVLVVAERPSVRQMSFPSKLTAYFKAGRPVVAAVDPASPTAREIERAGAGLVVPAGDPRKLIDAIITLNGDPAGSSAKAASAQAFARTIMGREVILSRAEGLVDRLIARTAAIRGISG